jgi:hypothetical protein
MSQMKTNNPNPEPVKFFRRTILVFTVIIAILCSPVLLLVSLSWWENFSFRLALPMYPGARQENRAYGYFGAGAAHEVLYFWSPDPVESVQAYYQEFAFPFRVGTDSDWSISAFAVGGADLVYYDIEAKPHRMDETDEIYCHYTQTYRCVNVQLVNLDTSPVMAEMPNIIGIPYSREQNATPSPPAAPLNTGTLIIYSYYVSDSS